jgi:hypothetical protein
MPRNQWHTFWNAGDQPARLLETQRFGLRFPGGADLASATAASRDEPQPD